MGSRDMWHSFFTSPLRGEVDAPWHSANAECLGAAGEGALSDAVCTPSPGLLRNPTSPHMGRGIANTALTN